MQKARDHPGIAPMGLSPLVGMWFQVHCPPLVGVLPIFRSRYCYAIGRQGVLSLAGWAPPLRARFHVSGPTQVPDERRSPVSYRAVTACGRPFQGSSLRVPGVLVSGPTTPPGRVPGVWAGPRSLAATDGVEVSFSSSGY